MTKDGAGTEVCDDAGKVSTRFTKDGKEVCDGADEVSTLFAKSDGGYKCFEFARLSIEGGSFEGLVKFLGVETQFVLLCKWHARSYIDARVPQGRSGQVGQ